MGTGLSDMTLYDDAPTFAPGDWLNESLSPWNPWPLYTTQRSAASFPSGVLGLESPQAAAFPHSIAQADLDFRPAENEHGVEWDFASGRHTRGSVPLDTNMWSPSPMIVSPYSLSGPHSSDVRSYGLLPLLVGGGSNHFLTSYRTLSRDAAFKSLAIAHTQGLMPDFSTSMEYLRASATGTTNLDHAVFPKNSLQVSPSSSGSIDDHEDLENDTMQPPVMLYRTPRRNGPHHRRCQRRACAINIEGLWIDKDDLRSGASQGNGMISVHECQWAKHSNPCGVWIIGSRPRVGTHIRKWHPQSQVNSMAKCLWNGCTASRVMLKDSINRHVVTVHLEEGFHCHGCNQELSRKDVYGQHVRNGLCRNAEVTIVYGRDHKVIDTKKALRRGGPVRYAD